MLLVSCRMAGHLPFTCVSAHFGQGQRRRNSCFPVPLHGWGIHVWIWGSQDLPMPPIRVTSPSPGTMTPHQLQPPNLSLPTWSCRHRTQMLMGKLAHTKPFPLPVPLGSWWVWYDFVWMGMENPSQANRLSLTGCFGFFPPSYVALSVL